MRYTMTLKVLLITCMATLFGSFGMSAQDKEAAPANRNKLHFNLPTELTGVAKCQCCVYPIAEEALYTCNKHEMFKPEGASTVDIAFNPSGYNYIAIIKNKKGENKAMINLPDEVNHTIYKFNNKKFGEPLAATFLPNGRSLLVAVPGMIKVLNANNYIATDTIPINIQPKKLVMSENLNYLAMTDGSNVTVLNYETKQPRFDRKIDGNVAAIGFNDDCSQFVILTDDGSLQVYNTRNFVIADTYDDLEGGIAFGFNSDGKYLIVAETPETIQIINTLKPEDKEIIKVEDGKLTNLAIIQDIDQSNILTYTHSNILEIDRLHRLSPYFGKLISEEANEKLNDWLKMMPGETMEQYNNRVNDESRRNMLSQFERDAATKFADNLLSMSSISLGNYNPDSQTLEVDFSNMPSIYLNVPQESLQAFGNPTDLEFRNAVYGVRDDDSFELIYAEVFNKADGQTYTFDNLERASLNFMAAEENTISLDVIRQQQMEEVKLQEIKEQVIEEAKHNNLISDHTNIAVDSQIVPDYDADGNRILNYDVKFTYTVDPEFTLIEDFGPGKYKVSESGAASSMLNIVKQSLEGELAQYVKEGKKLRILLSGSADATPINRPLKYDGCYGEFDGEPVRENGQLSNISVNKRDGLASNSQLAFVRALGVQDFIETNIEGLDKMPHQYDYIIEVSEDKGSQFRRITAEFIFVDAF